MSASNAPGSAPADGRSRVFVSSTLGELAPEREAAKSAIRSLRLSPILFELGSDPGVSEESRPWSLEQADVFVGIYWQSYGWVTPGSAGSSIEDELDRSGAIPRLIYVKEPAPERDPRLTELLPVSPGCRTPPSERSNLPASSPSSSSKTWLRFSPHLPG